MDLRITKRWFGAAVLMAVGGVAEARPTADRTIVYAEAGSGTMRSREWDGSAWSAEGSAGAAAIMVRWIVTAACPVRDEIIAACSVITTSAYYYYVNVQTGGVWGTPLYLGSSSTSSCMRAIDVAYEQDSGDALVVHRLNTDYRAHYRTWNGTSWTGDQYFIQGDEDGDGDDDMITNLRWVNLVSKPGADEIMLLTMDYLHYLKMWVWNGSAFVTPTTSLHVWDASTEAAEACYESQSGRCMVVSSQNGPYAPRYRLWSGSSWGSWIDGPTMGSTLRYVRVAPDPVSNKIIMMTLDDLLDVNLMVWDGSAWGSSLEVETSAPSSNRPEIGLAFEPQGTRAIAVWATSGSATPKYRVYSGTTWGTTQTAPALSAVPSIWQLSPGASGQEILGAVILRSTGELFTTRWDGSSFAAFQSIESSISGAEAHQGFAMTDLASGGSTIKRITSWSESAPR